MTHPLLRSTTFGLCLFFSLASAIPSKTDAAESIKADHIRVSWVAPKQFGSGPSAFNDIGIRFVTDPHWHIYWKNSGDSGAAPKFKVSSLGAEVAGPAWPFPFRIPFGGLINLGYEGTTVFPFKLTPNGKSVEIQAELEWLVCKEECVPGFGTLTLSRPVGAKTIWQAEDQKEMEQALKRVPSAGKDSPWEIRSAIRTPEGLRIDLARKEKTETAPEIFPTDGNFLAPSTPVMQPTESGWSALFQVAASRSSDATGNLVLVDGDRAYELASAPVQSDSTSANAIAPLWVLLISAFFGGVILNLMPCVFPVLSIKIFALLKSGQDRKRHLREGTSYTLGVMFTFGALGGVLLALRAAGTSAGWGFQLQHPSIVLALAALFWMIALNFLGIFEFGSGLMNWAGRFNQRGSAFASGMLSVFVAAPCTGPFMGSALGASAFLPPIQAMSIFLGLGLGLAAPILLLSMSPAVLSRLPKPGRWMETLKQFFAFPLFATVLWLLWVLGQQAGEQGWFIGGVLLLALSFCLWLGRSPRAAIRWIAWIIALSSIGGALNAVRFVSPSQTTNGAAISAQTPQTSWAPYDAEKIASLRSSGKAVFIDFTAAWCVTCQWNKKAVLDTDAATKLFEKNSVSLIRADWTDDDAKITEALAAFGRNSVPLYVFYPADGSKPRILPQILTISMIENLFNKP